ncbi:unnamed protein product [Peniophora sp. CBMAI 1063]|nr:unnamed protein product [Peniophora sp. CBMAI 1063]
MPRDHPSNSTGFFRDPPEFGPSPGQVWRIRESLMLPLVEWLKARTKDTHGVDALTFKTWVDEHGCKENPRPCLLTATFSKLTPQAYLMGTFNNGSIDRLKLLIDIFTVEIDPADPTSSSHHLHATPRWPQAKRQFLILLPITTKGLVPPGLPESKNQGYLLDRWQETLACQQYGFPALQLRRLEDLQTARMSQWNDKVMPEFKLKHIKDFKTWLVQSYRRADFEYSSDPTQSGPSVAQQPLPSVQNLRTKSIRFDTLPIGSSASRRLSRASSTTAESSSPPRTPPQAPAVLDDARIVSADTTDPSLSAVSALHVQKPPKAKSFKLPFGLGKSKRRAPDTVSQKSLSINVPPPTLRIIATPPASPVKPMSRKEKRRSLHRESGRS